MGGKCRDMQTGFHTVGVAFRFARWRHDYLGSICMTVQFVWLIIGLALLVKGGDLLVSAAVRIAEHLRMPRVVIGSTLVSLATTTPELAVSLMAGGRGESGLAVGNAVGSAFAISDWILGITAALCGALMLI